RDAAPGSDPAHVAAGRELGDDVRAAIGSLPPMYQEPLQQFLLAGRSPIEIAHGLGVERATIRVRLHRGLQRLRGLLQRWTSVVLLLLFGRTASARSAGLAIAAGGLALGAGTWLMLGATAANATNAKLHGAADVPQTATASAGAPHDAQRVLALPAPATGRDGLTVHVCDAGGAPVPGVGVTVAPAAGADPVLHRRRAVTDAAGDAWWQGLSGTVRISTDRGPATTVELRGGANEHDITLPGGVPITGRVVDTAGSPVADAAVWLGSDRDGPWRGDDVARTGADGTFTLHHVPEGAFVAARHAVLARSEVQPIQRGGAIELRLGGPGGTVQVRVLDDAGAAVPDALVFAGDALDASPLWLADGALVWRPPPFEARTDEHGRAATGAFAPGRHPLFVRATGHAPHAGWVEVSPDAAPVTAREHVVRLSRGARVQGRVVDAGGAPIAGALAVFRTADPAQSIDVHASEDGRFRIDCAPSGSADVAVQAPGHLPRVEHVELAAGTVCELVVTLSRAALVHGTVRRADGLEAAGAQVRATWAPSALLPVQETAAVAAEGVFAFTACGLGRPSLEVRLHGEPLWRIADAFASWNGDNVDLLLPADFAATSFLRGTLRCAAGGLAGARLFVCRDGTQWAEVGRTDADGAFGLGPLPGGQYDLFAETTARELPTVPAGRFTLQAGETVRADHTAPPAGAVDVELVRADGEAIGDVAMTIVGTDPQRRCALASEPRWRQVLLPGDYTLHAMGSRVQWLDGLPFHVDAGRDTVLRVELPPATRCALALQGLPRANGTDPLRFGVYERWRRQWSCSFTLPHDAPLRLAAVLAAGDYVVEHGDAAGRSWTGTFSVAGDHDGARAILVQMAPQ
ncbi:MAG TPA: carboxypeptidase regulatory-like domain-containing protein, partial [Planctomycetota bacterium]|nr:carboxypeptidase regulatory-like domain-containing protein [Planctomycetota bacterium]